MISDLRELAASLRYMESWADLLEGMRLSAQESDVAPLPTTSAGPLAEIRRVLAETRPFVEHLAAEKSSESTPPARPKAI